MSVDSVNQALTKVRRSFIGQEDLWGDDGVARLTSICETMRSYLMADDTEGFIDATQRMLGQYPDGMGEVLNQLFAEVCGDEQAVWEQFEVELRKP